jgi:queuine tRNA-ribosyltransferase
MIQFKITKKSKKSDARLGVLKTPHGVIETPAFVGVGTAASVKSLSSDQAADVGCQLLICNTFHLHIRPGEKVVKKSGGLHRFMNWKRPLMTDSGGFQVFSLGFGREFGMGKMLSRAIDQGELVNKGQQPKLLKITEEGVQFRSFIDGAELFLGPRESIRIQEDLGADIILAFDECPPPNADYDYTKHSLERTHRWAEVCIAAKKSKQALYGIVQGGHFRDLRSESSKFIGSLPFDGFALGGEFGADKKSMEKMIRWSFEHLPENKPRHLLGIGHPEDIVSIIKQGVDTFDCIAPTHYARRGMMFTSRGRLDIGKSKYLNDKNPIDKNCACSTCRDYRRNYLCHLLRAKELTAYQLLTIHNLHYFNDFVADVRKKIKQGKI